MLLQITQNMHLLNFNLLKWINELLEKVKAISTKGSTKYLINKYSILNEEKCFYSEISQIYIVFITAKNKLNILVTLLEFIQGNLMQCRKKVLKIISQQFCTNFCWSSCITRHEC